MKSVEVYTAQQVEQAIKDATEPLRNQLSHLIRELSDLRLDVREMKREPEPALP